MGTEFTYDDMSSRDIDDYSYSYIGDETINGYECYIVESKALNQSESSYSKIISWIIKDEEILIAIKVELYNKKSELNKILTIEDIKKQGEYYIPNSSTMNNLLSGRSSTIINKQLELDMKVSDSLFEKRFLTTGKVK